MKIEHIILKTRCHSTSGNLLGTYMFKKFCYKFRYFFVCMIFLGSFFSARCVAAHNQANHKKNDITIVNNRRYVEIEKEIVESVYENLEEEYKELQENPNNSMYYANVLESGAMTIINLRDFLFNAMEEDESGKKAIDEMDKNIKIYQKYLSGYYAGVIAEKYNTPESFYSIKNEEKY